ncbi:apyrase [Besnoitia besnoiti]|uniref:Apyrase n=1 Tax=Besnoitia besnoiti TaxID=94643 RepID=A0A2A9MFC9_BESBE|nr:apyrase [Besnoitia besnoiti]PFH34080.1 apyrase [Besnoitia besnoiti]
MDAGPTLFVAPAKLSRSGSFSLLSSPRMYPSARAAPSVTSSAPELPFASRAASFFLRVSAWPPRPGLFCLFSLFVTLLLLARAWRLTRLLPPPSFARPREADLSLVRTGSVTDAHEKAKGERNEEIAIRSRWTASRRAEDRDEEVRQNPHSYAADSNAETASLASNAKQGGQSERWPQSETLLRGGRRRGAESAVAAAEPERETRAPSAGRDEGFRHDGASAPVAEESAARPAAVCGASAATPCSVIFMADLDVESRVEAADGEGLARPGELLFKSYALRAELYRHPPIPAAASGESDGAPAAPAAEARRTEEVSQAPFHFAFDARGHDVLYGRHNEGGRGLELSELVAFNGELLTFDDRTGIVYSFRPSERSLIAKWLLVEGDGRSSAKGMKIEWATVKGNQLFVGSFGKEYTDNHGNILHRHNTWVVIIDERGGISRQNWDDHYQAMKKALGVTYSGYVIHEAINWSDALNRWVVLPRRVSHEQYHEVQDEHRGSNKLLLCSDDFSEIDVVDIQTPPPLDPRKGFSSFKFVPGTGDKVILAVKSLEDSVEHLQKSFVTIFDITGKVLLPDLPFPHDSKYEGVAFL